MTKALSAATLLTLWLMLTAATALTPPSPSKTVEHAVTEVLSTLRKTSATDRLRAALKRATLADIRRAEIGRIAQNLFDFDDVARRALGRHWTARTPAERAEFVRLFTALLERTYLGKIEMYSGETITFVGEQIDGDVATVQSRIVSPRTRATTALDYRLHLKERRWQVYDILIDRVSFVANYRSQFDRIIHESSYGAMIQQLRLNVDGPTHATSASPRTDADSRPRAPDR
jgi:phospholipid transport system substrate-binding protein